MDDEEKELWRQFEDCKMTLPLCGWVLVYFIIGMTLFGAALIMGFLGAYFFQVPEFVGFLVVVIWSIFHFLGLMHDYETFKRGGY